MTKNPLMSFGAAEKLDFVATSEASLRKSQYITLSFRELFREELMRRSMTESARNHHHPIGAEKLTLSTPITLALDLTRLGPLLLLHPKRPRMGALHFMKRSLL